MAEYILRFRDPKTLKLRGGLPKFIGASWTRRTAEAGEFSLTVQTDQLSALSLINRNTVVEVLRDGAYEFAGAILGRKYNAATQTWALSGPDIKGTWLSARQVDPGDNEFDSQTGVTAEAAMKHYVTDHLVNPTDSDRKVGNEIDVAFTVEADAGRGLTVNYNARWKSLLDVLVDLARAGGLLQDVVLRGDNTYEYQVWLPTDATSGSGLTPVVFSVQGLDNVAGALYSEDTQRLVNAVSVLGQRSGATRTVREVTDAQSIVDDFRREGHLDARDADTDDKIDQAGSVAIAQSILDTRTAMMEPLTVGPTTYRDVWDLGYDVTVDFKDIGQQVDRRIEEVTVTLDARQGEKVSVSLGRRPQTIARIIGEAIRRGNPSQVEEPQVDAGSAVAATTVVDETARGLSAAVGSSSDYSREDHGHGSAAMPTHSGVTGKTATDHHTRYTDAEAVAAAKAATGIADNDLMGVDDADAADDDYARFTATGLEGRDASEVVGDLSLDVPKRSMIIRAAGWIPNITNGCEALAQIESALGKNYGVRDFAANEQASIEIPMPPNYDGGTVTFWYYWISPAGSSAGDTVIFGLRGGSSQNGDEINEAFGAQVTVTDTLLTGVGRVHQSDESSAITIAGSPSGEDPVVFELERTGGTMAEEARLWMVYIRYDTDTYSDV